MNKIFIDYQKIFLLLFVSFVIYLGYQGFLYLYNVNKNSNEISYLIDINNNYRNEKNIYQQTNNVFESTVLSEGSKLIVSYKNINSLFCEDLLESIYNQEQIWTSIILSKNNKESNILMEDLNDKSFDFLCSNNLNIQLTIDKLSSEFNKILEEKKLLELSLKEKEKITQELEFILTNIYNFQQNKSAVDSLNNPYNRIFGFLVQNNSKEIQDRKKMIITYEKMPKSLCERFINVTFNHESDVFFQQSIIGFDRDKVSVLINSENIKNLEIHKVNQLCFSETKIRIETE